MNAARQAEDVAEIPAMCQAITRLRTAVGISNNELAHLMDVSQGTSWKWERHREPSLDDVARLERVLGAPAGTLFAIAGYAPQANAEAAVQVDDTLTDPQRAEIVELIVRARGRRRPHSTIDSAAFVYADTAIPEHDRHEIARAIEAFRYRNRSKVSDSRR